MFLSVVLPFSPRFWLLAFCFETTKTKREQPKPRREWQYNAEKHKRKASASMQGIFSVGLPRAVCAFVSLTRDNMIEHYINTFLETARSNVTGQTVS